LQTLSGGNQQKVLLAKWLTGGTSMVILNEPTAAVDVGAKLEIYDRLRTSCREDGLGVLVLTSDFEEASALCDRVTVLRRGAAVGELAGSKCSVGAITKLAYGGAT
jgi:ribose transport system ATP-binding protein